jgi:hypothetical protein
MLGETLAALALILLLVLAGCQALPTPMPAQSVTPTAASTAVVDATAATGTGAGAQLAIAARPIGVAVAIDGTPRGVSPMTVTLPAGSHVIVLSGPGFAPLTHTVMLTAGEQTLYAPTLGAGLGPKVTLTADRTNVPWEGTAQIRATAAGVTGLQLLLDGQLLGEAQDSELNFSFSPADVAGLEPGGAYTLTARAADAAGNVGEARLPITVGALPEEAVTGTATAMLTATVAAPGNAVNTPRPGVTVAPADGTADAAVDEVPPAPPSAGPVVSSTVQVTTTSIPTYPFANFLTTVVDPALDDYPVQILNRQAYAASNPQPAAKSYTLIVMENRYLRLSLLPDLGGRVYECVYKPTGHNEFYKNAVIKPTRWGPAAPAYPAGANWWLAAGGMEWGFPVEEHGYESASQWGYDQVILPDGSAVVTLFMHEWQRPYAAVDIILPPDSAAFVVRPRITNPTGGPVKIKWWSDAMLAPGGMNAVGPDLRIVLPTNAATVHSTSDPALPAVGQAMAWPMVNGRDLSRLGNWTGYLGFFARPAAQGDYMGVYDPAADEGMMRVYPSNVARGAKVFGLGWQKPLDWREWTDNGSDGPGSGKSSYIELHGGLTPTFNDGYELDPGDVVTWSETWFPVAKIGGVAAATAAGAVNVDRTAAGLRVRIFPTQALRGRVEISAPGATTVSRAVDLAPDRVFDAVIATTATPAEARVTLRDAAGQVVLKYGK